MSMNTSLNFIKSKNFTNTSNPPKAVSRSEHIACSVFGPIVGERDFKILYNFFFRACLRSFLACVLTAFLLRFFLTIWVTSCLIKGFLETALYRGFPYNFYINFCVSRFLHAKFRYLVFYTPRLPMRQVRGK